MESVKVFISYSHLDQKEKDLLVSHLRVLESEDSLGSLRVEAWDDTKIDLGEEWENKINEALKESQIAILLVTANFLTSDFILRKEVKAILDRHQKDLIVIPVIARHCAWEEISWLAKLNLFNGGQPVWDDNDKHNDKDLKAIATAVANHAKRLAATHQSALQPQPDAAALSPTQSERYAHILFISSNCDEDDGQPARVSFLTKVSSLFKRTGQSRVEKETPALLDTLRPEISQQGNEISRRLICHGDGIGVVVASFESPQELLSFLVPAIPRLRENGGRCLRIGLHSAVINAESETNSAGIPFKGINVARHIMELGFNGHVLCSAEAEKLLRVDVGSGPKLRLDPFPKRELAPKKFVKVFNINGSLVGNAKPPRFKTVEHVIRTIALPKSIRALRERKFIIEFDPDLHDIIVQFKPVIAPESLTAPKPKEDTYIRIKCGDKEPEDYVFHFDFQRDDSRVQTFIIEATKNPSEDLVFVLRVLLSAESDEMIATSAERRVYLYRKPPPPKDWKDFVGLAIWLWDQIRFAAWPVKAAICVLLIGSGMFGSWVAPSRYKERAKISSGWWPYPLTDFPNINFDKQGKDTLPYWNVAKTDIAFEDGRGANPDGALVLNGPKIIVLKSESLQGKSLYDFTADFTIKLVKGSQFGGWLFRARPDKHGGYSGYVFILERRQKSLVLHGTVIEDSTKPMELDRLGPERTLEGQFDEDDWIRVVATVKGYRFHFDTQRFYGQDGVLHGARSPVKGDFEDTNHQLFRHGNTGFWELSGSKMLVDNWLMSNVGYEAPTE